MAVDSQERLSAQVRGSERLSFTIRQKENFSPEKILGIEGVLQLIPNTEHPGTFIVETKLGSDVRETVARTIVENGLGLLELKSLTVSLEEVFLHLTTEEQKVEAA